MCSAIGFPILAFVRGGEEGKGFFEFLQCATAAKDYLFFPPSLSRVGELSFLLPRPCKFSLISLTLHAPYPRWCGPFCAPFWLVITDPVFLWGRAMPAVLFQRGHTKFTAFFALRSSPVPPPCDIFRLTTPSASPVP